MKSDIFYRLLIIKNIKISISDESDLLLETGGGLKNAAPFFFENKVPFALVNVDILTDLDLSKMLAFHNEQNSISVNIGCYEKELFKTVAFRPKQNIAMAERANE